MTDTPPSPLADRADALRGRMGSRARAAIEYDLERERGWLEAVAHLARRGGLNHAGHEEARKMVAASEEWFAEVEGHGR